MTQQSAVRTARIPLWQLLHLRVRKVGGRAAALGCNCQQCRAMCTRFSALAQP